MSRTKRLIEKRIRRDTINRNFKFVKEQRAKPTKAEMIVAQYLIKEGIYFIFQKGFIKPFHRIVDFYLPKRKIIIEVDGKIHDFLVEKDLEKDVRWATERDMQGIRIKNEQIFNGEFKEILKPITENKIHRDLKKPRGI